MKICAIICEFNPFHNGHKYLLERAHKLSGCDAVLCVMSGSFTQRGEMCILDKFTRARHAVLGGADCVIQLPSPFAVAPAEVFAKGAIKILSAIPDITAIAFGCKSGNEHSYKLAANLLIDENETFKKIFNDKIASGESYIKSYAAAFEACGGEKQLITNPNNILGLEYTKSIMRSGADIEILPIKRIGADYNDGELKDNYSSASAIRRNLKSEKVKDNLPDFVYIDLINAANNGCEDMQRACLFKARTVDLKRIYGCGEGLENKLKSLENEPFESIIDKATSKRYSSSRIRRILCANMLELYQNDVERFLQSELYIKPLAVKKQNADCILSTLAQSRFPVITGANGKLSGEAEKCFEKDKLEFATFNHLNNSRNKDYMIIV